MIVYNHNDSTSLEAALVTGTGPATGPTTAPSGIRRLLGQVLAVREVDRAVEDFQRIGFTLSDRLLRDDIGLDTATFQFANGTYFEIVAPSDPSAQVGATVQAFLDRRGEGPYLACFEVDDVHGAHERLVAAGIPVVGPPQSPPSKPGMSVDVLWLKPRATAGAFMQLLSFREPFEALGPHTIDLRLFTEVITVAELAPTLETFTRLGLGQPWAQYQTELWGLQTAVFRLPDHSNLEIVSPRDTSRPAAAVIAKTVSERGGHGHYMTVFASPDVHALADRFDRDGVPTLGRPVAAPPESPWGPVQQFWVHPRLTHGAFIEFLTPPGGSG